MIFPRYYPIDETEPAPGEWEHRKIGNDLCVRPLGAHGMPIGEYRSVPGMMSGRESNCWEIPSAMQVQVLSAPEPQLEYVERGDFPEPRDCEPSPVMKPTNPKDTAAVDRPRWAGIGLATLLWTGAAKFEGLLKYGAHNYTIDGARAMVYVGAALSHIAKWTFGERCDPTTGVHHLGNAVACLDILLDTEARGVLVDDRPPSMAPADMDRLYGEARSVTQHLIKLYGDRNPRHFTIADTKGKP